MDVVLIQRFLLAVVVIVLGFGGRPAVADEAADLHRAYYLEHAGRDHATARAIYAKLASKETTPAELRAEAVRGAARCRDELAAANLALLMPEDALSYVAINRPGALVGALAEMLGLGGADMSAAFEGRADADSALPFTIPSKITISPALLDALGSFGGAAAAVTEIQENGPPTGIVVLHHGGVKALKGLIETAFQFSPPTRKIGGLPTFGYQDKAVGVLTESLLIVGTSRSLVEDAVERLVGKRQDSLAGRAEVREILDRTRGATLFAFVDAQRCIEAVRAQQGREGEDDGGFAAADALLDLKNLKWAALSIGTMEGTLGAELTVRLGEGHRNLIYNLIRTPPMSRRSLDLVPASAAAVIGIGLNRQEEAAGGDATRALERPGGVTGLDIGRELFANIEEIAVYVVPGEGGLLASRGRGKRAMPNVGVVIAARESGKSAALWDELLSLSASLGGSKVGPAKTITIAGTEARSYELPEVGTICTAEADGCLLVGLTRPALRAGLLARQRRKAIGSDATMSAALEALPADASFLAVVHAGRCAAVAAELAPASERIPLNMASEAMKQTVAWAGVGESPAQLSVRVGVQGLPDVNALVQKFAPLISLGHQHHHGHHDGDENRGESDGGDE